MGQSSDATRLIDEVIEAYGGRQPVLAVRAYRIEATMQAHSRRERARIIRIVQGPDRLQVLLGYPSRPEIRVLDGEQARRGSSPHNLPSVRGPMRSSMELQAARVYVPWILDKKRFQARLARTKEGTPVLDVPIGKGLLLRVFVDAQTHRVTRSESVMEFRGMAMQFHTIYSDFRKVEGVLFPFHEENFASGRHTATTLVERIQVNPSGSDLKLPGLP
jgi:hypothetical protein